MLESTRHMNSWPFHESIWPDEILTKRYRCNFLNIFFYCVHSHRHFDLTTFSFFLSLSLPLPFFVTFFSFILFFYTLSSFILLSLSSLSFSFSIHSFIFPRRIASFLYLLLLAPIVSSSLSILWLMKQLNNLLLLKPMHFATNTRIFGVVNSFSRGFYSYRNGVFQQNDVPSCQLNPKNLTFEILF